MTKAPNQPPQLPLGPPMAGKTGAAASRQRAKPAAPMAAKEKLNKPAKPKTKTKTKANNAPAVTKRAKQAKLGKAGKRPKPVKKVYRKATPIARFVPDLTKKAFEKYGFSAASLLTDWSTIVGPDLAAYTFPEKLKWPRAVEIYGDEADQDVAGNKKGRPGATLVLRVDGPRAVEIQYKGAQILERINAYFGYRAISEMRVLQAPLKNPIADDAHGYQKLEPLAEPPIELNEVENEELREALGLMAAGIERRRQTAKKR